ncbi:hypothetical protein D3C71_1752670 [compost metagenome]
MTTIRLGSASAFNCWPKSLATFSPVPMEQGVAAVLQYLISSGREVAGNFPLATITPGDCAMLVTGTRLASGSVPVKEGACLVRTMAGVCSSSV